MNVKEQIKQNLKEIEVYSSHSLFALAKQKCLELMEIVEHSDQLFAEHSDQLARKEAFLEVISRNIGRIEGEERSFEGIGKSTRMSNKELDVVKQMVCVPDETESDEAIWEVARACLILGQYATALGEFDRLVKNRFKGVAAAKNMLRCHIGMSTFDEAINQYKEWSASGLFTLGQMENIRTFLQELLYKNKIDRLITTSRPENNDQEQGSLEDEFIDLIGVKLTTNDDADIGKETMLDVNYQKGSTFSVVIPKENMELLDYLEIGKEISTLEMYSSPIIFSERCLVYERSKVKYGPRNGDYSVCLKILKSEKQ